MLVPAALEQWAAEHNEQLSTDTLDEVNTIASTIRESVLGDRSIVDPGDDIAARLDEMFSPSRSERAETLVQIVADWHRKNLLSASPVSDRSFEPAPVGYPTPAEQTLAYRTDGEPIGSPAFLRSDMIDEEDAGRLYGPKRPWKAILGTIIALGVLAGAGFAGWYWYDQRNDSSADVETSAPVQQDEPDATQVPATQDGASVDSTEPTAEPEPTAVPTVDPADLLPSYWADTSQILNSGTAEIAASTYVVSPANRAVLTGHTAAITGIVVSDDGRVLTSGADLRLVDWGADVTLANPDVLNVPSPLTVLERTVDQRIIAGDSEGNITIIDLVNEGTAPVVLPVHSVAIAAATELIDGRLAVASVDGEVAIFEVGAAGDATILTHDNEVTAVAALADGSVATASVDGIVRIWDLSADDSNDSEDDDPQDADSAGDASDGDASDDAGSGPGEIDTLGAPVTALIALSDGRLATASVLGDIHIVPPTPGLTVPTEVIGHVGAVRALHEVTLGDGSMGLASGGDDNKIWVQALDGGLIFELEGHGDLISGLASLPDGRLVSTSGDGTGRVWDLSVPSARPVVPSHVWNVSDMHAWNNDQFVTGGLDGRVVLGSTAETSQPSAITEHDAPIVSVAVLQSGDVISLDTTSLMRINTVDGDPAALVEFELAPGATTLAVRESLGVVSGHADGSVRFHDLNEEVAVVEAHGTGVNDVVSLGNGMVASAGQDTTVRIIDFENPDTIPVFDLHTAPVDVVIELPDGRIASSGSDGIYVYTLEGLAQDHIRLNGSRARTISLLGLPGDRLISTGDDGRVRLWDLTTPEAEPVTLVDIPGIVNPYLIQAENGLFVAGAARGYVVFTLN